MFDRAPHISLVPRIRRLIGLLALISPFAAHATTIAVTTTEDAISIDGECSLREAVTAANSNLPFSDCPAGEAHPATDVIELPPGTYRLTLEPVGDDANLGGDLDITEALTIRGLGDDFIWWDDPDTPDVEALDVWGDPEGFPRTFVREDLPDVVIDAGLGALDDTSDGDRVIHIFDPDSSGEGARPVFTFRNLAIVNGDASCTGVGCSAGAAGIQSDASGDLVLERVTVFNNQVTCSGDACGQASNTAAVRLTSPEGDLTIDESVIAGNRAFCAETACRTGRLVHTFTDQESAPADTLTATLVTGNRLSCSAEDCNVGELLQLNTDSPHLEQLVITGNEMSCSAGGLDCETNELVELQARLGSPCAAPHCSLIYRDVEISENRLVCEGFDCDTDEVSDSSEFLAYTMERMRIRENEQRCSGVDCDTDEILLEDAADVPGASFLMKDVEILDNIAVCSGAACSADEALQSRGKGVAILENVFVRGESRCIGDLCTTTDLVDLTNFASITGLVVRDSTVSCVGTDCTLSEIVNITSAAPTTVDGLEITGSQAVCMDPGCGNDPPAAMASPGEGGMLELFTDGGELRITGAVITGNVTTLQGTVALDGTVSFTDSVLANNQALDAGAIWNGRLGGSPGALTLIDTAVDGNSAIGNGGGINNPPGAMLTIVGGSIASNAAADGGGIYNEGTVTFVSGAPFESNTPNDCVNAGAGTGCIELMFTDGFESGDTTAWSAVVP